MRERRVGERAAEAVLVEPVEEARSTGVSGVHARDNVTRLTGDAPWAQPVLSPHARRTRLGRPSPLPKRPPRRRSRSTDDDDCPTPAARRRDRSRGATSRRSRPGAAGSTRAPSRSRSWPASCSSCSPTARRRRSRRRSSWPRRCCCSASRRSTTGSTGARRPRRSSDALDHANIFLLIAGTYTPLAVLRLARPKKVILLSVVWGGALLGILFRVFWLEGAALALRPLYLRSAGRP